MDFAKPILIEFPNSFTTERLIIRQPLPGDGEVVYVAMMESLDQLQRWMPWAKKAPTLEDTEANVRQAYVQFLERTDLRFHLFHHDTKEFIGSSGLHRIDWKVRKYEIGYWCRSTFARQGYITEAVKGLTVFAFQFLEANRVEIRCDEQNLASRKVAERVGFQMEGILRNHDLSVDQKLRNTCVYSMISEDFLNLAKRNRKNASM
ncbi:GNAT family N-acetyltransferase [Risungbinella massiliensis]|uniref:GNAT family N-acetyltransferase n=1 Tax=Risungbinella massiliensis TaxID=1329796 RepID=UPI0005CC24B5|nr:GNAT family N-acetyltransferase [Risungbinella massiliensis]